jgi:hypothetical protein
VTGSVLGPMLLGVLIGWVLTLVSMPVVPC